MGAIRNLANAIGLKAAEKSIKLNVLQGTESDRKTNPPNGGFFSSKYLTNQTNSLSITVLNQKTELIMYRTLTAKECPVTGELGLFVEGTPP